MIYNLCLFQRSSKLRQIKLCGYFCIVTSEKMTAREALILYKSRDDSEKTFRGDKSYLGANCERVYKNESIDTKIFIGFVATIIRCKIYTLLKDEVSRMDKKQNYMTVPAALKELEKIELLKGADNEYNLDYAIRSDHGRLKSPPARLHLIPGRLFRHTSLCD